MEIRTVHSPVRKCGTRKEYGVYATGGEDGDPEGTMLRFNRINPPVPYQVKLHRGPRIVDATALLDRQPMDSWWAGSSANTELKKSGDAWAQEIFGMTLARRLSIGECAGCQTPDDALAQLLSKLAWDNRITDSFRALSLNKVQELPRTAAPYNNLHESLLTYCRTGKIGNLVDAQAAIWRLAYSIPPSRRVDYVPSLVRMLALMGLVKDGLTMSRMFP
jgi:hypothetical protein